VKKGLVFEKDYSIFELNGPELDEAESLIFKLIFKFSQMETFFSEYKLFLNRKPLHKSNRLFKLNPFLDKYGVLRLRSRLDAAPSIVADGLKYPILLGRGHIVVRLIVEHIHKSNAHAGREFVVNELRQKFWIPHIRAEVNGILSGCLICRFRRARPEIPKMSSLPKQRLSPYCPPFSYTGCDFFGPLEVVIGRRREKRYGCLFTCLSTRAIHLELTNSLETDSCILAFRNFINRRGPPIEVWSDNGTNLRGAEKELRLAIESLDRDRLVTEMPLNRNHIKWNFIPPSAPHFGGSWERMVGLVKRSLYRTLKTRAPREEVLRSLLIEVENMVNSRPLYYSGSNDDLDQPAITPNNFLRHSDRVVFAPGDLSHINYKKQWRFCQEMCQEVWKRWMHDYLPTISRRSKWYDETKPLEIGTLVLVVDDQSERNVWKRAIVETVHPGSDGRVRTATVRTANGVYLRPVSKLAVIDLDCQK
jgi:transposase InsO family protein